MEGGVRSIEDVRALLSAGCDKVSINSAACKDPEFVRQAAERFGSQCIVVNIDPKRVYRDGKEHWEVHINGGRTPTGLEAVEWATTIEELGAGEIVLTSMDADGTCDGYDLPITSAVSQAVSIPVVASGGAGSPAPGRCNSTGKSGCRTRGEYFSLWTILNRRNKIDHA